MRTRQFWLSVLLGLMFIAVYTLAIQRNLHERSERTWEMTSDVGTTDRVLVFVKVTRANPGTRQLTAQLRFQPIGIIAQDAATPKVDLRFLVNNSLGQRIFEFPKGEAISNIEVTLPMEGVLSRYPFDRYETNLWLQMDTPEKSKPSLVQSFAPKIPSISANVPESASTPAPAIPPLTSDHEKTPPAEIATLDNRPMPISISVLASTTGLKYTGEVIRSKNVAATRVRLQITRPYNVVNVSIIVMCLMMGIALSVVAMVLKAIVSRDEKLDVLPLSLSIGLIFGLPALRNIQPGVPPVGALGDYFSFVWAEVFVAAAAIIMALTWVFRTSVPKE
ncbi:MAG: DUF4436 family protein [Acidobacteriota bacterium]